MFICVFNKARKSVKIIEYDVDGIWLYQKKLFSTRFLLPDVDNNGKIKIDVRQLKEILKNVEMINYRKKSEKNRLKE